ncbi:MAG: hypothetical protein IKZ88_07895 [Neisseriaceae bacterium]|nr:hypothetical protein [Neisseriaceae bacterium]
MSNGNRQFFRLPENILSVTVGRNAHPTTTPTVSRWVEDPPYGGFYFQAA